MQVHQLSLSKIAQLIRGRDLSAREVVQMYLRRIEQLNPKLNAFIEMRADEAMREAEAADRALASGEGLGALHGVPLSIKSSIAVAGLKYECGSRTRVGLVAEEDATLVRRLKQAGAIILGNTNVPEMLMAYETDNPLYGRSNNPWDLTRTPGGSSGGEAAAIVAGLSAGGIGSDGGGSIRVPAHFSGICGLKPTPGRIPATGHWPESLGPFALLGVVGPMARTVEDVEMIFRAIAGFDAGDAMSSRIPLEEMAPSTLKHLKIGYFEEHASAPVTAETRDAVRAAASALQGRGMSVEPFDCTWLSEAGDHWWTLFVRLGGELLQKEFKERESEKSSILIFSTRPPSKEELLAAWFQRDVLRLKLEKQMEEFPILLCPVCSVPAFHHGEREWQIGSRRVSYMRAMSYTQWFNLLGNPALVVPVGQSPEGLPIGVQLVGRANEEERLLKVGRELQAAIGSPRLAPMMAMGDLTAAG
ncbi:MAG: amidase [Acidobacteria bacterium]|nr:amidase [Acidobacteriota bacterium]